MRLVAVCGLVAGSWLAGIPAVAAPAPEGAAIAWATPLAGGPLRVLFIVPRAAYLECEALAQRVELDWRACTVWSPEQLGAEPGQPGASADESPEAVGERLRSLLSEKHDLVLLGRMSLSVLPEDIQSALAEKVRQGAGLLLAHVAKEEAKGPLAELLAGLEIAEEGAGLCRGAGPLGVGGLADPGVDGDPNARTLADALRAGTVDAGRVAQFDFPGDPPLSHAFIPVNSSYVLAPASHVENAYAWVVRAMLWAAGRSPSTRIAQLRDASPVAPPDTEVPPDLPKEYTDAVRQSSVAHPLRPFVVELQEPADADYEVWVQVRKFEADMRNVYEADRPLKKGERLFPVDLLIGPGRYLADVWLRNREGVADWFTRELNISGWPNFKELQLSKESLLSNDSLAISLRVPPIFNKHRACTLYARALDPVALPALESPSPASVGSRAARVYGGMAGRCVAEALTEVSSEGSEVTLELGVADLLAPMLKIEVFAAEGPKHPLAPWELNNAFYECRYVPVRLPVRKPGLAVAVSAPRVDEPNLLRMLGRLQGMGVDTLHAPGGQAALWNAAWHNLSLVPELAGVAAERAVDGVRREPCLSQPPLREGFGKQVQAGAAGHWAGASGRFSLGNRNILCESEENVCQCEACLAGFRAWLQGVYGDTQKLNDTWGSGFRDWSEVSPPLPTIALEAQCYAGWTDFRRYMDSVFCGFMALGRERVRGGEPQAQTGFGLQPNLGAYSGYDWRGIGQSADWVLMPPDAAWMGKWNAFHAGPGHLAMALDTLNAPHTAEEARWLAWYAACHGAGELWCGPLLSSGAAPPPALETLARTVQELRQGPGLLLRAATRAAAKIAVYDTPASRYVNALDRRFGMDSHQAERGFLSWLEAEGMDADFVGEPELQADKLKSYRLLILPAARALGPEESAAIRAFAEGGGHVLADVAPGVWGGHGERVAVPALDMLFGIRRQGEPETIHEEARLIPAEGGGEVALGNPLCGDNSVVADSAVPGAHLGGTPVWLRGTRSLLLNHGIPETGLGPCAEVLRVFVREAGCSPTFEVHARKGGRFEGARFAHEYGNTRLMTVLAAPTCTDTQKLWIEVDKTQVVYDLRQGKRLGKTKRVEFVLSPGEAACFAVAKEALADFSATLAGELEAGRRLEVAVAAPVASGQRRMLTLALEDPARRPMPHYGQTVELRGGAAKTYLPLALNEVPGWYTLTARDCITGVESRHKVFIGGRVP